MILAFGGTTEGRIAVKTLGEGVGKYFYSTKGDSQYVECVNGVRIVGEMDRNSISEFCKQNAIRLIIDAAHPFASNLHQNISGVSEDLNIPVVRFERHFPDVAYSGIIPCENLEDAIVKLKVHSVKKLLALSGVQTIEKLKPFWNSNETYFRILNRPDSIKKSQDIGFPSDRIIFYEDENLEQILKEINPDAIITKESGESGGFIEKIEAVKKYGIKALVVKKPKLSDKFIVVNGPHGLRREIEKILPDFFPLHTGLTTGSCATAAAKAALIAIQSGIKPSEVQFDIPEGETLRMAVDKVEINGNSATAFVTKDAGDDPDVTDKCTISVTVNPASHNEIKFYGGEGVGTVTLPGLGIEVGQPAINPVPRKMIASELRRLYLGGLDVTVSVINGEEIAKKTFNSRVGIVGGISIIGTSGIVRPLSHEAFIESIKREISVAVASGCDIIAINSGGKSEGFMHRILPELPPQAFIHYGNAIGEMMDIAQTFGVKKIIMGIMLGKAVKLAEGHLDTHSHKVALNKDFLKNIAEQSGCSPLSLEKLDTLNFARELPHLLSNDDSGRFFSLLLNKCVDHCSKIYKGKLDAVLFDDNGLILKKTWE